MKYGVRSREHGDSYRTSAWRTLLTLAYVPLQSCPGMRHPAGRLLERCSMLHAPCSMLYACHPPRRRASRALLAGRPGVCLLIKKKKEKV